MGGEDFDYTRSAHSLKQARSRYFPPTISEYDYYESLVDVTEEYKASGLSADDFVRRKCHEANSTFSRSFSFVIELTAPSAESPTTSEITENSVFVVHITKENGQNFEVSRHDTEEDAKYAAIQKTMESGNSTTISVIEKKFNVVPGKCQKGEYRFFGVSWDV